MENIRSYLFPGAEVFMIGIGGVSMSALAEVLHARGLMVSGADRQDSQALDRLRASGLTVTVGEDGGLTGSPVCAIRTAAARDDNPLVLAARARGIPVLDRAEVWGTLMTEYRNCVCVAGTHGKTSTTSMLAHITMAAGLDPTIMLGGTLPLLGAGHRIGKGDLIVAESCEYCNSFLKFNPTLALVLNAEADHLDFFKDLDDIISSFCRFCQRTSPDGKILIYTGDAGARRVADALTRPVVRFGPGEEFRAENIRTERGCRTFDIVNGSTLYTSVALAVPGEHNMLNALAAACASCVLGIDGDAVRAGLESFHGAGRRLEFKGTRLGGIPVYDDYAHHPSEITATLTAVRDMGFGRILCAFQPHTYSRTQALFDDFVDALKLADLTFLSEIYAAREANTGEVTSARLAARIPHAVYAPSFAELAEEIKVAAKPDDVVLTMGAGDIYKLSDFLV